MLAVIRVLLNVVHYRDYRMRMHPHSIAVIAQLGEIEAEFEFEDFRRPTQPSGLGCLIPSPQLAGTIMMCL